MFWPPHTVLSNTKKERAPINLFTALLFFVVFGVIFFSNLLLKTSLLTRSHLRFSEERSTEEPPIWLKAVDAVWQPVAGTRSKFFVYSAFVERRNTEKICVIGAAKTLFPDAVVCRIWLRDSRVITVPAIVNPLKENWNLEYSASFIMCRVGKSGVRAQDTAGAVVAVMAQSYAEREPTNLLPVLDTLPKPGIENNLHVCVKPFYNGIASEDWLVEWFEFNRLLNVSHFYMYNESMSASVACVVEHYRRQGLVTLLRWNLPFVSRMEIRTGGQFAAFSDCLYRSMSSAGWLLIIDVDELVIPRRERTLPGLLSSLSNSYRYAAPSVFNFRNTYFYLRWEDDPEAPEPLLTARKTRRWIATYPNKNRTKYVLRPTDVVELGNHFVWKVMHGVTEDAVPVDRALLHHYRAIYLHDVPSIIDRTTHRWAKELMPRVTAEKQEISKICQASEVDSSKEALHQSNLPVN